MNKPWTYEPASEKQLNRVKEIERLFGIKYEGALTKGGVGPFIGEHRDNFFKMEHDDIVNESFLDFLKKKDDA